MCLNFPCDNHELIRRSQCSVNITHHQLIEQLIFSIISMKSVILSRKCRHPVNSCLNTKFTVRWHYQCSKNQTQLSRVFRTKHYRHPQWNSLHRVSCYICHYQDFRQAVLCLLLFPFLFLSPYVCLRLPRWLSSCYKQYEASILFVCTNCNA